MPVTITEIILALALISVTAILWQKNKALHRQLDDIETYTYKRFVDLSTENERLALAVKGLRRQSRQLGGAKFTPEMTVGEALEIHPRVLDILAAENIVSGGCGCHGGDTEDIEEHTLQEVAQEKGVRLPKLMTALNALGDGKVFVPPTGATGNGLRPIPMAQPKQTQNGQN